MKPFWKLFLLLLTVLFLAPALEAGHKSKKKSCPQKVYNPGAGSNYKGHKCPKKKKIKLQKYY
ncbi:MAG TPA: hypothetical protein PKO18_09325 [Chitinophagales bacterium]|nr:hypothetical protein [Chitinophagales bacterium]HNL85427.1 hypothetical protein [Chitinophagales bacterium]